MKKVHFEIEVEDQVIEGIPESDNDIFCDAQGKTFLFHNPFSDDYSAVFCANNKEDKRNANLAFYYLPSNARIVSTENGPVKDKLEDMIKDIIGTQLIELMKHVDDLSGAIVHQLTNGNEQLKEHIQQCCDKCTLTSQEHTKAIMDDTDVIKHTLPELFSAIQQKVSEHGAGNGISEHTLLRALEIVSGKPCPSDPAKPTL